MTPYQLLDPFKMDWDGLGYSTEIFANLSKHRTNLMQLANTRFPVDACVSNSILC